MDAEIGVRHTFTPLVHAKQTFVVVEVPARQQFVQGVQFTLDRQAQLLHATQQCLTGVRIHAFDHLEYRPAVVQRHGRQSHRGSALRPFGPGEIFRNQHHSAILKSRVVLHPTSCRRLRGPSPDGDGCERRFKEAPAGQLGWISQLGRTINCLVHGSALRHLIAAASLGNWKDAAAPDASVRALIVLTLPQGHS